MLGQRSGLHLYIQDEKGQLQDGSDLIWSPSRVLKQSWMISLVDLDEDGALDFYLGRNGRNRVFMKARGQFAEEDMGLGIWDQPDSVTTSASWGDLDRDGDYDLMVGLEASGQAPPDLGDPDQIFIREGMGFESQPERLVEDLRYGYTYGAPLMDLDNDGWLDIYVMNHMSDVSDVSVEGAAFQNYVLRNTGNGKYSRWDGTGLDVVVASMGSDVVDLNGDGIMDIMVAGVLENLILVSAEGPVWYREDFARGVTFDGSDDRMTAWASTFADLNNDARVDIVAGFGPGRNLNAGESEYQPDAVWLQGEDGRFEQVAEAWGLAQTSFTKVLGIFDYNSDGWLDILKSANSGPSELWLARCGAENWLRVELEGAPGDPHGIGSRITIQIGDQTQTHWIHSMAKGLLISLPYDAHFGLDDADFVDSLTVDWLDGSQQTWFDVPGGQRVRAVHPEAIDP
jgi:hypothetical protein